jgi:hypothetical protein
VEALAATAEYDLFGNQMLGFFGRQGGIERPLTSSRRQRAARRSIASRSRFAEKTSLL